MESKIQKSIQCLYAVAAVQAISLILSVFSVIQLKTDLPADVMSATNPFGLINAAFIWPVIMLAVIYFVVQNLKKQNEWAWVGALSVFVFTIPSFAVVFSALGILFLLDRDVRGLFLTKLDIKL